VRFFAHFVVNVCYHEVSIDVAEARLDEERALTRNALLAAIGAGVLPVTLAAVSAAQAGGRVLTAMDTVSIRIVADPELDTTARVEPDGTVNFPYVGRIKAAGLTEDELAQAIERRLIERQILPGR
jgi:protein involved in polysaccharide export with SLBB domain